MTWKTPSGDTIQSSHPPVQEIVVSQGNTWILTSLLKKISIKRPDDYKVIAKDIKNIQAQNNYTNIVLQSMCSQVELK